MTSTSGSDRIFQRSLIFSWCPFRGWNRYFNSLASLFFILGALDVYVVRSEALLTFRWGLRYSQSVIPSFILNYLIDIYLRFASKASLLLGRELLVCALIFFIISRLYNNSYLTRLREFPFYCNYTRWWFTIWRFCLYMALFGVSGWIKLIYIKITHRFF